MSSYELFLRTKSLPEHRLDYDEAEDTYSITTAARFAALLGLEAPPPRRSTLEIHPALWDYQRHYLEVALRAKRYAAWWDTGLGKTVLILEWARQVRAVTGGRVLIVAPLNLITQFEAMALEIYGAEYADGHGFDAVPFLGARTDLRRFCSGGRRGSRIAITNPHKFLSRPGEPEYTPEVSHLAGVALDESSLLKTGGGKIKWSLIKSCRGVEYKLSCSATPAPNEPLEYASQASWLELIRSDGEVLWTFFTSDKRTGRWYIKPHAVGAFYRFLSSWSCYLRHPARFGFADNLRDLPAPERRIHEITPTSEQRDELGRLGAESEEALGQIELYPSTTGGIVRRGDMTQIAAGFRYRPLRRIRSRKPDLIADLVAADLRDGCSVIVWTSYDETAELVSEALGARGLEFEVLTGKVPAKARPSAVGRFTSGEMRVLVTRPRLLGYGANLQRASSMVFADLTDSYEDVYQAERRAYRYGQTRSVRIHYPLVKCLQDHVWANLERKREQFEADVARMEQSYLEIRRGAEQ